MDKEEARQKIAELITKYESLTPLEIKSFNEAKTKQGFIEPLLRALGWDFDDTNEVTPEERASSGRVDYAFKIQGISRFYLEAKSIKADLNNPEHMRQAVTYAYGNGVTWAVLTNFEELRLLSAQKSTPFITLNYESYVKDFDKLWLLSRQSLADGLLSKEATQYGALPSLIPIEERLFKQLRLWREEIYNQLSHYNDWLKREQRDEVIEKLFNRLIFIRTCEDRKLEERQLLSIFRQWQKGGNKKDELLAALRKLFNYYRGYYDSDLFAPHLLDDGRVFIYDDIIANILIGLYDIPGGMASYDFAIIDADVLGRVYEQYLGYIAKAVVEKAKEAQARLALGFAIDTDYKLLEKKQHRKEQGIYYTPKFVTDYIVKETVGRFIKENEHDGYNRILNIKILDPACGSGSFLIRAYDELLNYHARIRGKTASELEQTDRLPILTRNVFGVDLDERAVEIARLNLLLRGLAKRDLLPPLTDNIKQGNSLISGMPEELKNHFGEHWESKHPFTWEYEFKDIMQSGGFDVVIGNPPYVNESRGHKDVFRELKEVPKLRAYYEKNMDLFNYFIELGLDLLKEGGFCGYIIPSYWQDRTGATLLRQKIVKESNIERLVNLGEFKVFQEAPGQHNNILILQKVPLNKKTYALISIEVEDASRMEKEPVLTKPKLLPYALVNNKLIFGDNLLNIVQKLEREKVFYLDTKEVARGVDTSPSTYDGKGVFILSKAEYQALSKELHAQYRNEFFKPFYEAKQIDRYYYEPDNQHWLIYTDARRRELLENDKDKYRVIVNHLDNFRDIITSDNKPYGLHRPKNESNFLDQNKLMFVRKTPHPKFVFVPIPYFVDEAVYLIIWHRPLYSPNYLLSIFNSRLAKWWFGLQKKHGGQLQIDKEQILSFPIRCVDFDNFVENTLHDKLVALVTKMMELNKRLAPVRKTYCNERDEIVKQVNETDKEIDTLVYDIYGLTQEERKLVEESGKS